MTDTTARAALRSCIAARAAAREQRQAATDALHRADYVLAELGAELERHTQASESAEATRAQEIAAVIRRGAKPNVTLSAAVTTARHAEADSKSRHAVAEAARVTLAAELAEAETSLAAAERTVTAAAMAVVADEARPLAGELAAATAKLIAAYDALTGLAFVGLDFRPGTAPPLPPEIRQAIFEANNLAHVVALIRPPRIISAGSPEATAAARWRGFLKLLGDDAEAALADVSEPAPPALPDLSPPFSAPIIRVSGEAA